MATLTLRREDGRIVCERVVVADRAHRRMRGLLGRKYLRQGEGMVLRPGWSIHTAFMRFPIDAVFLDADQVVIRIEHEVGPWRTVSCRGAREVVEMAAGESRRRGLEVGDRVAWASRSAADARTERANGTFDDEDDEPRARILVASSDPRFLRLARFLLGGRDLEVEELTHAGTPAGGDSRRRPSTWPCSTAPIRSPTRCARPMRRGRADPRSRSSSRRTRAGRARPASACSTAGTRPRSSSSTSSACSPSASRAPLHRRDDTEVEGAGALHWCGNSRR